MPFIRSSYAPYATPQFRILSDDQIHEIYLASLEVLERTGIEVFDDEAVELLRSAGARVSNDGKRVRIPSYLVEEALRTAPKKVTLCSRDGQRTIPLEDKKVFFGTGSDNPFILDSFTGERRRSKLQDMVNAAIIADYLPNIDFHMGLGLPEDIPTETADRHQFRVMVLNTKKPLVFTAHDEVGLLDIIEMAAVAMGSREQLRQNPLICLYAEPTTPLRHSQTAVRKLLLAARELIPVVYTPAPMSGASAPATMAGILTLSNAESLSGLVIAQLAQKGAPVIIGGSISIMDMRRGINCHGAPEQHLLSAALASIDQYYGIPMFGAAGRTDSKVVDEQAAMESALSCLMTALAGANLVHDVGYIGSGLTCSYDMLVMGDEIIAMVKRIMKGIEVTPDTLALDVINAVGPGGNFLLQQHTRDYFKKEHWVPELIDRNNHDKWVQLGSKTMGQRVNEKVKHILAEYRPEPLAKEQVKEIDVIIARREDKKVD